MKREVNLRDGLLLVYGAQSIIDLDFVPNAIRHLTIVVVHDCELGLKLKNGLLPRRLGFNTGATNREVSGLEYTVQELPRGGLN